MLEQETYVREKLRHLDVMQTRQEPATLPLKKPVAPVARGAGRALLWLGQRLEAWAEPREGEATGLELRRRVS
jgi:hypothetical protein